VNKGGREGVEIGGGQPGRQVGRRGHGVEEALAATHHTDAVGVGATAEA
jgi:hypothetical protein